MTGMKILVPLKGEQEIESLQKAGADELYFGFTDEKWQQCFGEYSDINRMSAFKDVANRIPVSRLNDVVARIHSGGMAAYVTLNAPAYTDEELEKLDEYLCMMEKEKPDGVIVSEPSVVRLAAAHHIRPVASTMCGIFNSDIGKYYAGMGVGRMILPREMSLDEIRVMREELPDVELEVFLMRNGCIFADSHCLGMHGREYGSLCKALRTGPFAIAGEIEDFRARHEMEWNIMLFHEQYRKNACGLCALYRLVNMGITAGKIVGRADNPAQVAEDVALVRENLAVAADSSDEEEYLNRMKWPRERYHLCKNGMCCYYPEVRFPLDKAERGRDGYAV